MKSNSDILQIKLSLEEDSIAVTFINTGDSQLHLWEFKNSWGYYSISFEIKANSKNAFTVVRKQTNFTRNFPSYFSLLSKESIKFKFDLNDQHWDFGVDIKSVVNQNLTIKAVYLVSHTPESDEYKSFVGTVESNSVVSAPPHKWIKD